MRTRVIQAILLASILTWVWGSVAWAGERSRDRSQQRIHRQTRSVERGGREQRRFDRAYGQAASDGYLNRQERKRLHNMQDRASRHIYRAKHSNLTRYRHHGHYKWGYHTKRYHGPPKRHHYWRHRKGQPQTVVYTYRDPYTTRSYFTGGYAFSGTIHEPGWTLGFSTGGPW